jgi:adenylate cyclase
MAHEIERKFLVCGDGWRAAARERLEIRQGYLSRDPERTVRARLSNDCGFLTIKGLTQGRTREEFEYAIPVTDGEALLRLCLPPLLEKTRHVVDYDGKTWEVDEFHGRSVGLIVAEIELDSEDEAISLPDWIGREVTDDPRYFNTRLAEVPFDEWDH